MSAAASQAPTRDTIMPALAMLASGLLVLLGLFWRECQAAVGVWIDSTAYGHCFLVVPIALFLAWDRRDTLRGLSPRTYPAAALLTIPLTVFWLASERLGIMEFRQLAAIALLQVLFLSVLGWQLYKAMAGPLLYLFFLVPFGLFLTPVLQSFTARFIDLGLNVIGIPHFITDMTIEISAGTFFVAEACAGLRFLIASIAFGVFFALLNYTSTSRRVWFIVASIIVPIIANGFRALGIVVLGNILGSAQAAAADHIIYGWFFFSFVTLLLVLAGLPFRQPPAGAPAPDLRFPGLFQPRAILLTLVLAALGPAASFAIDRSVAPAHIGGRPALITPPGCTIEAGPETADQVSYAMACSDRAWTIAIRAVPGRSTGAALAEARRVLIGPYDAEESVSAPLQGAPGWQTIVAHEPGLVIASAAWIDGQPAPGGLKQRLLQARDSILGASNDGVAMVLSLRPGTVLTDGQAGAAIADLQRFVTAQPDLGGTLAKVTEAR